MTMMMDGWMDQLTARMLELFSIPIATTQPHSKPISFLPLRLCQYTSELFSWLLLCFSPRLLQYSSQSNIFRTTKMITVLPFSDPLMAAHGTQAKIWNLHVDGYAPPSIPLTPPSLASIPALCSNHTFLQSFESPQWLALSGPRDFSLECLSFNINSLTSQRK